ncbi:MAG TPA: beta-phosphoglucomutase family hydrolase [Thermoleophilaceae bacterium]
MATRTHNFDAVLFDLDGVLTSTAAIHARCWKAVFDELPLLEPFDIEHDYLDHVDGKPRYDGVRDFLASRDIALSEDQVREIGDRKQLLVEKALEHDPVEAFPGSVEWVEHLRREGLRTAVVSSSTNAGEILRSAGIDGLFETTVSGRDIAELDLNGKPAPDGFLEAARRLDVSPHRAVVVEDALAGVTAGRAGGFGLVVGVARHAEPGALRSAGADMVVEDLAEMLP